MNEVSLPLIARYPKTALFALWIGAFSSAIAVGAWQLELSGENFSFIVVIRRATVFGLVGIISSLALTAVFAISQLRKAVSLFLNAMGFALASLFLACIAQSLSPGAQLTALFWLAAAIWSMAAYSVLFFIASLYQMTIAK